MGGSRRVLLHVQRQPGGRQSRGRAADLKNIGFHSHYIRGDMDAEVTSILL